MARQIPFTEYEAVLLLDAYLRTLTEGVSRRDAVNRCSDDLRRMAVNNGLAIDSIYRNTNGITFQMASMESAYRGKTIVKPATRLFTKIVRKYTYEHDDYERLLKKARTMAGYTSADQCAVDYENIGIWNVEKVPGSTEAYGLGTDESQTYKRDDKEEFYQWMLKEQHMAQTTCRSYVSAIQRAEKYAAEHGYTSTMLYGVDVGAAENTADELFKDAGFVSFNEGQHNRFRAAITKLLLYLGREWNVPNVETIHAKKAENSDIDTKHCKAILEEYFPRGYRLNSSIEMKKFRRYFEGVAGTALAAEQEKAEAVIRECGVVHDGRVYMAGAMLSVDMKEKLFAYIESSFAEGKTAIYFEALFQKFSEEFLDHYIYDADMLKEYISYAADGKYFIGKNYLAKERHAVLDPIDDVRTCLKEHGLPMGVDRICRILSHLPESRIRIILRMNGEFVRNGREEYFHADSFSVTDEELDCIASLIHEGIEVHEFISGNELYDSIQRKYPHIYERNTVFSVIGWREALKYNLGNRFSFSGNVISRKDADLSRSDVFADFAKERQSFTMKELLLFAENIGTAINFDALYKDAARISEEMFVSKYRLKFQITETDEILDRFCIDKYLPLPKITDFGIFPDASYPWTPYLLEQYLASFSKRYDLMHVKYNRNAVVGAMVKKTNHFSDFDELMTDELAASGIALQKNAALNYLADNGYIAQRSYANIESLLINARAKRNKEEK